MDFIYIQYASKLIQYHVFVFTWVLEKSNFHFKVYFLENTDFCLKPKFNITKMVQIVYDMCWIFVTHICILKILQEHIFVEFMWFYEIYLIIKGQVFTSFKNWSGLLPVDRSGRPTCTNVHASLGWWAGRPSRELCSLEMAPVDRRRAAALCI